MNLPTIRLKNDRSARLRAGSPWIYSNELDMPAKGEIEPGSVVRIANTRGHALGLFHLNPNSLIAARKLSGNSDRPIDQRWFMERLRRALSLREMLFDVPYYRLSHGEADGMPGLVIDRFDDACVVQCNTAGMERMRDLIVAALEATVDVSSILLRNDSAARKAEGLQQETTWLKGHLDQPVQVIEHGIRYLAALEHGQKTGWYYDQRDNRRLFASFATGKRVLDLYSYTGGFGLAAAAGGAQQALMIDSSRPAIDLARDAGSALLPGGTVDFEIADVFDAAAAMGSDKRRFDLVSADPPPFARAKKDVPTALKAYQKLARLSSALVSEGGLLALSCCSHNVRSDVFLAECHAGIRQAGRSAMLLTSRGADLDHPIHPALPESSYLRFLLFRLD